MTCFSYLTTALPYENAKSIVLHCIKLMYYSIIVVCLFPFAFCESYYYDLPFVQAIMI